MANLIKANKIIKQNYLGKWLLILNLALCFMGVGQIWQVQMSSYPLWAYVGVKELHDYHVAWWHSIWIPLFVPAGLSILCTIGLFWFRPTNVPRKLIWASIVVIFITYVLTYLWWAPLMAMIAATPAEFNDVFNWAPWLNSVGLRTKTQEQLYNLLITTHWLRFALLNLYGFLIFWISILGFESKKQNA